MQRYDTRCKGCNQVYPCIIPCTENSLRKDNEGRFVLYDEAREQLEIMQGEVSYSGGIADNIRNWCVKYKEQIAALKAEVLRAENERHEDERQIASLTSDIEILRNMNRILKESLVKLRAEVADYREVLEQIHVRALLKYQVRIQAIADAVLLKYDDLKEPEVKI